VAELALSSWIERIPPASLNRELDRINAMRREGWQLTLLIEHDTGSAIVLGFRVPFASTAAGLIKLAS
jgi:hypothetical protein